jgi:hypothetical protein
MRFAFFLADCVAVTQNYVNSNHLVNAMEELYSEERQDDVQTWGGTNHVPHVK